MMAETKNTKAFNNTEIPSDWEIKKVGDFGKVYTGNTPLTSEVDNYDGDFLFVSPGDLSEAKYIFKTEKTLSEKGFSGSRKFSKGAVLFTCIGSTIGKSGIATVDLTANQQINAIVVNGDNSNEYLYYQLERNVNRIKLIAGEQAVPIINKSQFETIKLLRAPLPEQKAIAQVLSTADAAIHTTEKLIAQKELRKKWLMQQLLTGKKRLKGFSGEWKKERLEKYLVKHDEKSTINNQYPVLTSSRRGIFLQSDYYTRDVASEDNTGYNVVPRGYFTYRHMSDDLIFKFNINDIVDRGIVSTLYPVFTTKDINSYFLLVKLNEGSEFKMHAEEQKQGGSRTYVYFKTLCQLKLNLPTIEEQTAIAQVLQAADKEISLLKVKAEKLREQKKGLMQLLLTGKKRLKIK
jgi:type I restriction enzyme S subunit